MFTWLLVLTQRTSSEADPSILFLKTRTPPKPMWVPGGVGLRNRSGLQIRRQPRAPTPRGAGFAPARPSAKSRESKRQAILAVGLHDGALPASLGDGQLRGAPGTNGEIHDMLAQLVITRLLAETGQSLGHMLLFDLFARGGSLGRRQPGGGKAQGLGGP